MLAAHLAVEAERMGDSPAWLIDTDRQGTLTRWHERRKADTPQRGEVRLEKLAGGLVSLASQGAAFCFIDTAPTISNQTVALIELADLIVIPVRPSPSDLWAVTETVQMVKDAGKLFIFVLTQVKKNATITGQAMTTLSAQGPVAKALIGDRVAYAAAMTGGNTAPELFPKGPVAIDIESLWIELKSCFHEKMKAIKKAGR